MAKFNSLFSRINYQKSKSKYPGNMHNSDICSIDLQNKNFPSVGESIQYGYPFGTHPPTYHLQPGFLKEKSTFTSVLIEITSMLICYQYIRLLCCACTGSCKSWSDTDLTRCTAAAFEADFVCILRVFVLLAVFIGQSKFLFYDCKLLLKIRKVEVSWLFTNFGEIC